MKRGNRSDNVCDSHNTGIHEYGEVVTSGEEGAKMAQTGVVGVGVE